VVEEVLETNRPIITVNTIVRSNPTVKRNMSD